MRPEVLVVGGGPSGAAAALALARLGRRVTILEREAAPRHAVCGEFLSAEAVEALSSLGLPPAALGGAPVERVRLAAGRTDAAGALPFRAFGLSRRRMDAALLDAAASAGATIRRGARVRGLSPAGEARLEGGETLSAERALLATGKHGLRGWKRQPGRPMLGGKLHFALRPDQARALDGHVELHLLSDGYAGLQLVEGGTANLCWLQEGGDLLVPAPPGSLLASRLEGAVPLWPRPLAVARVPYGHLHAPEPGEAVFRLGDQAAVTPSFTGDGMAIALHSGLLAAAMIGEGAPAFHAALRRDVGGQMRRARLLLAGMGLPAVALARLLPGLLGLGARLTRLPHACGRVFNPLGLG
ncbi:NAD(P)/FAD-dependent oxidoreductase [Sabulicella glaciei]|uniref:FAD-dependent oxidoreductase n=1 Tax=Sabulicella glaciei TaxID=2984948 RepID=A0ABT3P1T8_9PROT|nr:FAD-dependent oxidoreductase [Roseococcus sp. MDT2-1-1]MCW8088383.1 FAD-dependent oxidoreductase [Roseococcus sp. MDT2-1-1]